MKTSIDMRHTPTGYVLDVSGKFGGGYSSNIGPDVEKAASALSLARSRYLDTNKEGGTLNAPPEVLAALEAGSEVAPERGTRISYYASPEAVRAIQAQREATGDSVSGSINALVMRE
jgi:hypothetical protein